MKDDLGEYADNLMFLFAMDMEDDFRLGFLHQNSAVTCVSYKSFHSLEYSYSPGFCLVCLSSPFLIDILIFNLSFISAQRIGF